MPTAVAASQAPHARRATGCQSATAARRTARHPAAYSTHIATAPRALLRRRRVVARRLVVASAHQVLKARFTHRRRIVMTTALSVPTTTA
eukprot:scaffold284300_cov30-Tisochrysis_lutea.AAC.5